MSETRDQTEHQTEGTILALTWNVLAQSYVREKYYPGIPSTHLDGRERLRRLLGRLGRMQVDVGCLQEVEPDVVEAIRLQHPEHEILYAQRAGRKDGCAVFWRRGRFRLREERTLRYANQQGGELALIALLEEIQPDQEDGQAARGARLAVACTHLRWMPEETAPAQHIGALQMQELLAERTALLGEWPVWLVAGDFNAAAQSPVVQAAYAAGLAESCRAQRPWDTTNINRRRRKLDYLLYSGLESPEPLPLPALGQAYPMPSEIEPSDHLALSVRFRLVPPVR